ncbi:MAG: T9SS type A sorting domain-containing protein [Dysgonamonadaceae bacterium]|nr:T9SS type A sorting domain-containing protein [Dysgonamonadaceae bacterium]
MTQGDWIFSPRNYYAGRKDKKNNYHLHLRRVNDSENPLSYILYTNTNNSPKVQFNFQRIIDDNSPLSIPNLYTIGEISSLFPVPNVIYGDVMLQSKVDVTNPPNQEYAVGDADMNTLSVKLYQVLPYNNLYYDKNYTYTGNNRVTKSDVIIDIFRMSSFKYEVINDKSQIESATIPGIYPSPKLVSIDYFKDRLNTYDFLDGKYVVKTKATDIRGVFQDNEWNYILDNYYPYIKQIEIEDEKGRRQTFSSNGTLAISGGQVKVIVTTSEPMNYMSLRGGSMILSDNTKQIWYRTIDVPPTCGEEFILNFDGYDLAYNQLLNTNNDNYLNKAKIIRDADGATNKSGIDFGDNKYKFFRCPKLEIVGETDFNPCDNINGNNKELTLEAKIKGAEDCNPILSWTWSGKGEEIYGTNKYKITYQEGQEEQWLYVHLNTSSCPVKDSVRITNGKKANLQVKILGDSILFANCEGEIPSENNILLTAVVTNGGNNLNYQWNNGKTDPYILVSQKGTYSVSVTSEHCNGSASKTVTDSTTHLSVNIIGEHRLTSYCGRTTTPITLSADVKNGIPPFQYFWYNAETDSRIKEGKTIEVEDDGYYYVIAMDGSDCAFSSELHKVETVNEDKLNVKINGGDEIEVYCNGNAVANKTLTANVEGGSANCIFVWNGNSSMNGPSISIDKAGTYSVSVTDTASANKCVGTASIEVKPKERNTLKVSISAPSIENLPCNTPIPFPITLTANISGGSGWYATSWDGWDIPFVGTRKKEIYSEGYYAIGVTDVWSGCSAGAKIEIFGKTVACPQDPNEISGPIGYGEPQMVAQSEKLNYTVRYENDPDFATAPATRVKITVPISDKQNIRNFRLSDFGFGSFVFTVPQNATSYYQRLNVADALGVWVDVTAGLDITKNEAFWIFQAIDPQTGIEPVSAQMGFLPVNDKDIGNGEGYVNFSILPATTTHTGDTVLTQASITFDENETIETNVWSNVIDAGNPQSRLNGMEIPSNSLAAEFTFTAQDDDGGSGIKQVEIYVSENEGAYTLYTVSHPDSTLTFYGASGTIYSFFSIAEDNVGNREPMKTEAEFMLNFNQPPTDILLSGNYFNEKDYIGTTIGYLTTIDDNPQSAYCMLVEGIGDKDNDLFGIYGNQLVTNSDFNCKEETAYTVRIRTTDIGGLWFEKAFELEMIKTSVVYTTKIQERICQGETFTFHGQELTDTGVYYATLQSLIHGCDSIIQLTLTVHPVPATPLVTITGTHTLVSSSTAGNQWYDENGPVEGANAQSFTPEESGIYYVTVSNEFCESAPSDKYKAHTSDQALLSWDWKAGWYWFSVNLTETVNPVTFFNPEKQYFSRLLSQTGELIYDPVYGFVGDITAFDPRTKYKLQMKGDVTKELSGTVTLPGDHIITLHKGWNWIGYPVLLNLDLPVALSKLDAESRDAIKSQTDFAVFDGTKWSGTLTALNPGEGYMYYSASNKSLEYSSIRVIKVTPELKSATSEHEQPWEFNPHNYPNNMNIVAQLYLDKKITPENAYTVGAFSGEECRGIGKYINGRLYITVHGTNIGETITFKAIENQSQKEAKINESVSFDEIILGTLSQPHPLNISIITDMDDVTEDDFSIYPIPVKDHLTVRGDISKIKKLQIFDLLGKTVLTINDLKDNTFDVSYLSEGMYTVSLYVGTEIFNYKFTKVSK